MRTVLGAIKGDDGSHDRDSFGLGLFLQVYNLSLSVPCGGTLTILPQKVMDGTNLGIRAVEALGKPLLVFGLEDASDFLAAEERFVTWLRDHDILILNINGPRESSVPGVYAKSKDLFAHIFAAALRSA